LYYQSLVGVEFFPGESSTESINLFALEWTRQHHKIIYLGTAGVGAFASHISHFFLAKCPFAAFGVALVWGSPLNACASTFVE